MFLIDGHNLIKEMPDINLEDEADEVQLVYRLRGVLARANKKGLVFFDRGLPGGHDPDLSNSRLQVRFASSSTEADDLIIRRIRSAKDPGQLVVVSSDRRIRLAAEQRRARVMTSAEFVVWMQELMATGQAGSDGEDEKPTVDDDLDYWLTVFPEE
ncbi:MAG: NYN domain-containing protein [Anaerolineae bacterium]